MSRSLVVFDFDGTLADSFPLFLETFDATSQIYGFRPFDRENMDRLRCMEAAEVLRYHRVPFWKLAAITRTTRRLTTRGIGTVGLVQGFEIALPALHGSGHTLAILTSNSRQNVECVLGGELSSLFSHFECKASIFAKQPLLKKIMRRFGASPEHTSFIGDELRDLRAAKALGVRFGAVAWGYNSLDSLVAHGAEDRFASPRELANRFCSERACFTVLSP